MNKTIIAKWLNVAWLLPCLCLVGCSSDNDSVGAGDTGARPLTFTVSTDATESVTRGVPLNALDGEFGVFCSQYTGTWSPGHALNFMYNEMVMGNGTAWTTSEGYFVPAQPNKLKFFAYYPYYDDVVSNGSIIKMDGDNTTAYEAPSFNYTMPTNAEDQYDLMYAISEELQADNAGKLGTVHLNFHHLLTAITIAAKGTEGGTIKRVTLKNLYPKGDFEFIERDPLHPEYGVLRANKSGAKDVYADLNLKIVKDADYVQADEGLSFMIILQPLTSGGDPNLHEEASMEVKFEAPGGKIYTFTKPLDAALKAALTTSKNTLLRLSVESLKRITVKATITDWEHGANFDGAVSDQPQIELESLISDWDGTGNTTDIQTGPQVTNP